MNLQTRIAKLEQGPDRGVCPHVYTIKTDGVVTHDPPACSCGGERRTIDIEYVQDWRETSRESTK